jgi:hypothetical protein
MGGVIPQAVLFDTFGTVVDWRSGIAAAVSELAGPVDPLAFADAWRARYQPSMEPVRAGRRPFVRLTDLHRENLTATLAWPPPARRAWPPGSSRARPSTVVRVQDRGVAGDLAAGDQVDRAGHRLPLVHGVGDHSVGTGGQAHRVEGVLVRGAVDAGVVAGVQHHRRGVALDADQRRGPAGDALDLVPGLGRPEARAHQPYIGAGEPAEQDVADLVVHGIGTVHPGLLDQHALEPEAGRDLPRPDHPIPGSEQAASCFSHGCPFSA